MHAWPCVVPGAAQSCFQRCSPQTNLWVSEGVVYWVRCGKQRELKTDEGGKSSWEQQAGQLWDRCWCALCIFGPAPAFCFYHQLEHYRKKMQFPLRESRIVYGPTQRLPAAVLSGQGEARNKSIRHVFPLGGAPFLDLYKFL